MVGGMLLLLPPPGPVVLFDPGHLGLAEAKDGTNGLQHVVPARQILGKPALFGEYESGGESRMPNQDLFLTINVHLKSLST